MHATHESSTPRLVPLLSVALFLLHPAKANALPIAFGVNQGSLEYDERQSEGFTVYHDRRVPSEGARNLNALEYVRPLLEKWLEAKRKRPLPVVTSAVTANASFANFIADAIEVQTMGQADKELAWHEYTHSTMYRKLDNWFGPAGAILHLLWMPAWFLEGLAEAISVSVGSDVTAGIERYQALTGDWPSYDRLHSLYSKSGFFERGYSTSGAIVSYLLRKGDANKLPMLLDDFYRYSLPWWWPWAAVPFNGFMPMDAALENYVELNGEALYQRYKEDAAAFWKGFSDDPLLVKRPGTRKSYNSTGGFRSDGQKILDLVKDGDDQLWEMALTFDPSTGFATSSKKDKKVPEGFDSYARAHSRDASVATSDDEESGIRDPKSNLKFRARFGKNGKLKTVTLKRSGTVLSIFETPEAIGWLEWHLADTKICHVKKPLSLPLTPLCGKSETTPRQLRELGMKPSAPGSEVGSEFWYVRSDEKAKGVVYDVKIFDGKKGEEKDAGIRLVARPLAVAFAGDATWLLVGERNQRTLRRYDHEGRCQGMLTFKDHITNALGLSDGSLVLSIFAGGSLNVIRIPKADQKEKPCKREEPHTSPLLFALQQQDPGSVDLKSAVSGASLWTKEPRPLPPNVQKDLFAAKSLDLDRPNDKVEAASRPAKWRPRPLFLFPWIGAEDALGTQYGLVSVPLMDELQNEQVRATFLYGAESRFPYQQIALTTTRFRPTLSLSLYRQQTYNGVYINSEGNIASRYYDEKGGRFESDIGFRALGGGASLGFGVRYAHLKPYIGPDTSRKGFLAEPAADLSIGWSISDLSVSTSVSGRVAPPELNDEKFDYNQLGFSASLGHPLPFLSSRTSIGLEGSRTRGKKQLGLQEIYRPLKTFVPGSGGGYNQNSFPLSDSAGLFNAVYGDTQARAKANWTFPLIPDVDKQLFILYLERLDFTAFYNYGAAWFGPEPRRGWEKLIRAHGYSVDLQLENKGVRFNAGVGAGQVVGRDFEVYITSGFDALF